MKKKIKIIKAAAIAALLAVLGLSFSLSRAGREKSLTAGGIETAAESTAAAETSSAAAERESGSGKETEAPPQETGGTPETVTSAAAAEAVCVYICGEVRTPGVYTLKTTDRVNDAVLAADGFTEAAARNAVNLAEFLTDGEMIRIPSAAECAGQTETAEAAAYVRTSGKAGTERKASASAADGSPGKVNINTADLAALMTLPGIGEQKAGKIIAWREQNGAFRTPEEIQQVSGIKEKAYSKLKDRITVQ